METIEKKKKVSKKFLTFAIVGLFAIALISAAVVTYVSNTSNVNVMVKSPMKTYLNGNEDLSSLNIDITSADPITFTIYEKSMAEHPVKIFNVLLDITSDEYFSGNEFESIYLTDNVGHENVNVLPFVKYIRADGTYADFSTIGSEHTKTAKLMMASNGVSLDKFTMNAGSLHTSELTINTVLGATGTYDIAVCDIYTLAGADCE